MKIKHLTLLKLTTAFAVLLVVSSFISDTTDKALARTKKATGKLVFFHNEPISEYEIAFTFEDVIDNFDCLTLNQISEAAVLNANSEAGNQGKIYDGIIIGTGERDIAVVFKDKTKGNSICRVNKSSGKYVFERCEPLGEYDVVKQYKAGEVEKMLSGRCPVIQEKIDAMIKKADKSKQVYDGIIMDEAGKNMVIKFK